ncbi:MAG: hypothetical protein CL959_01740 [Euryarchaeota archaeon]|nr:hypothetical protein [Euryarchaeota archaeon]|tara:strand:- start:783 stop:995 length:213 start_codon:yes stop_codon:yes gene_type:complete
MTNATAATVSFTLSTFWYQPIVNADYSNLSDKEFNEFVDWANRVLDGLEFSHVTDGLGGPDCLDFHFTEA